MATPDVDQPAVTEAQAGDMQEQATGKSRFGAWLREIVETLVLAAVLYLVINTLSGTYEVYSISMQPTLYAGQRIITSKITYWLHPPERGDVVVFDPPVAYQEPVIPYIKRVIGLPGDTIEVRGERVYVNGVAIDEPYIKALPSYSGNWVVEPDAYFVLGDNRNNSSDSHSWGLVPEAKLVGKAFFVYWPPESWGTITHYDYPELPESE